MSDILDFRFENRVSGNNYYPLDFQSSFLLQREFGFRFGKVVDVGIGFVVADGDGKLTAFSTDALKILWEMEIPGGGLYDLYVVRNLLVVCSSERLTCIDVNEGTIIWERCGESEVEPLGDKDYYISEADEEEAFRKGIIGFKDNKIALLSKWGVVKFYDLSNGERINRVLKYDDLWCRGAGGYLLCWGNESSGCQRELTIVDVFSGEEFFTNVQWTVPMDFVVNRKTCYWITDDCLFKFNLDERRVIPLKQDLFPGAHMTFSTDCEMFLLEEEVLTKMNSFTGEVLWELELEQCKEEVFALVNNLLFITDGCTITAIDCQDGSKYWEADPKDFEVPVADHFFGMPIDGIYPIERMIFVSKGNRLLSYVEE